MQVNVTPGFITSLAPLVVAFQHNPVGAAYLVTLAAMVLFCRGHNR